jgi:hypothetical protein
MRLRLPSDLTGYFGQIEFKDGVSVKLVSPNQANMMRALVAGVQVVEDDGETVDEALMAMSVILPLGYYIDSRQEPPSKYLTQWNGTYPEPVEEPVFSAPGETNPETLVKPLQPGEFTREYLEALADKEGITGLRKVAPEGVKANSVVKLIEGILDAQNEALNAGQ